MFLSLFFWLIKTPWLGYYINLCLLLKTPAPVVQISCCYMKVKFYDQKLKLGRKLFFVVVGWILLVVMRVCLFLLFLKRSQLLRVSALWAFWGMLVPNRC